MDRRDDKVVDFSVPRGGEEVPRQLLGQPLSFAIQQWTVGSNGQLGDDVAEPSGLLVGEGLDHADHPVLETRGRQGWDSRGRVWSALDEMVTALQILIQPLKADKVFSVIGVEHVYAC